MPLIALGGIGFIALRQLSVWLWGAVRRRHAPLYLHTRAVLLGSTALWLIGGIMFIVLERNNTMGDLSWPHKILAAMFQSVTPRTAGYNTLDFGAMREPTLLFTVALMLIGAAPGSCAGGLKITTVLVIIASIRARLRGDEQVSMLKRTIPVEIVSRAYYTVILGLLLVVIMVGILLITEEQFSGTKHVDRLTGLLFETASAFGTVGLSTGITPQLTFAGKLVIILTMFCGRLGPLAVALAVFRQRSRPRYEYPKEELAIG
jgi:trk system potassium uptake protein TrkH